MKIVFYGTREYDHYYFDVLAADPEYGCEIKFLTANLDADTAALAEGGDAVCAFVNADCSAPVLERLARLVLLCWVRFVVFWVLSVVRSVVRLVELFV